MITKVCLICNRGYDTRSHRQKYCSTKCANTAKVKYRDKICPVCGIVFYSSNGNRLFCSKKCYGHSIDKKDHRLCKYCNKQFTIRRDYKTEFCSWDCRLKYCSENNLPVFIKKHRVLTCVACGNTFRSHNFTQKYCNMACFHRNKRALVTKIETELYNYLDKLNIIYEKQYNLKFTTPDAFISNLNICIYADGLYWHRKELVGNKDKIQTRKLRKLGYNVIRLKERKDRSLDLSKLVNYLDKCNRKIVAIKV